MYQNCALKVLPSSQSQSVGLGDGDQVEHSLLYLRKPKGLAFPPSLK